MEIKDILDSLGLDWTDPEVRRGAADAINAILGSRMPADNMSGNGSNIGGAGTETEIELDPDLIQPSIKQASQAPDEDIEIEDEERILDQIKHNDAEEPIEDSNSSGDTSKADDESGADGSATASDDQGSAGKNANDDSEETNSKPETEKDETIDSNEDEESDSDDGLEDAESSDDESDSAEDTDEADDENDFTDDLASEENSEDDFEDGSEEDFEGEEGHEATEFEADDDEESEDDFEDEEEDEEEFDFDDEDFLDQDAADTIKDTEAESKVLSRKRKRERTIEAAKQTLEKAKNDKVSPALIKELEKAIEALEALTEAVSKNIKDISDEEFNQLVNRVLDAIDAVGGGGLKYTTDEERELRAKEIKDDLAKAETQNELSAEDVAQIRSEHQKTKAREKEAAKYAPMGKGSFKGFQDFINSLYRAIALQVSTEKMRDSTWSAISRRDHGAGVLQKGQKVQDLNTKKIPVIDFYFDQSGSWSGRDVKVGEKAVAQLADMEKDGKIKVNVFYFSNHVHTDAASARREGGTNAWNDIVKNVIATQATNVIIMTDWDMENNWGYESNALSYTVPGYVWYLWKNGENAPRLPRDLKGRGGVQQFAFTAADA